MIEPYAEIEAETQEDIDRILNKLNIPKEKITKLDVCSIYKDIYNIDLLSIKNLTF